MGDNKRIAKNTALLYLRMTFTMIISLYTSRVILHNLGVEDYGLYQVVGGIVVLLSFVNSSLSSGSTRFLMYGLGEGNMGKLKTLFSTLLSCHILLGLVIILLAETIGMWFVKYKLNIPEERMDAALIVYHISILSSFLSITQPPYTACIKSHERMDIYAYTGIVDTLTKLLIVYLLVISPIDKLVFYAVLLFLENIGMIIFLRYYCIKHFEEAKYRPQINTVMIKKVLGYSVWNLYSSIAGALNTQGLTIMINIFFNASVVTALSIANTVRGAVSSLVENFRVAVTPQIVKQYAAGHGNKSMSLALNSTKYSFYLLYLLALPVFLLAPELIYLWLGIVPEYSVVFLRFIIFIAIANLFRSCFLTALIAMGRIKENAIYSSTIYILCFSIIFLLFKNDFSPIALSWVTSISEGILGLVVLPLLIIKIGKFRWFDILSIYKKCFTVFLLSTPIPAVTSFLMTGHYVLLRFICISTISCLSVIIVVWLFGIEKEHKNKLKDIIKNKLKIKAI